MWCIIWSVTPCGLLVCLNMSGESLLLSSIYHDLRDSLLVYFTTFLSLLPLERRKTLLVLSKDLVPRGLYPEFCTRTESVRFYLSDWCIGVHCPTVTGWPHLQDKPSPYHLVFVLYSNLWTNSERSTSPRISGSVFHTWKHLPCRKGFTVTRVFSVRYNTLEQYHPDLILDSMT